MTLATSRGHTSVHLRDFLFTYGNVTFKIQKKVLFKWMMWLLFKIHFLKIDFKNLHLMTLSDLDPIFTSHVAQNAFSMHRSSKIDFLKIHTWWSIFGDLDLILTSPDAQNAFSVHRSSTINFLQICTWWPLVTLTLFWPPMNPKIIFLYIVAQKYFLKTCTWWHLETLTWFWSFETLQISLTLQTR